MRVRRGLIVGFVLGATLALPLEASADGGAYFEMDRTHYVVGGPASGIGYVSIPMPHQDLLERGPFYVYVVPGRSWIQEGRPLPSGAIRVGTATIERESGTTFAIGMSFTVPQVPGDYYNIQMCNDPCTVAGFQEPLSAYVSIVQTEREAELLNELDQMSRKFWGMRHQAKKAEKLNEELTTSYDLSRGSVVELSAEISRLERELEAARAGGAAPATSPDVGSDRPLVEAWALVALGLAVLVAFTAIGLALVFSRRAQPSIVVPDTIAELEEEQAPLERV
jgi:hypothetical protein